MKVLVIGPSDIKSKGGMATVISDIGKSEYLNDRFEITIFPSYIDGNIIVRLIYSAYAYLRFLTIYKKYDLFHIHVASYGSTFRKNIYQKKIKQAGKKTILHIHGAKYVIFYQSLSKTKKRAVVDFLKGADMVLALSDEWKERFDSTFGLENCRVLNNGIDTAAYESAICDVSEYRDSFLFLGRLGQRKGAYDLVYAMKAVSEENPDIKLYMAGDGDVKQISNLVKDLGLSDHIVVVGWTDSQKKISLLRKVSTVVLPSYNEGLPMAILEGMAAGKAIISTTVGAIPEVIDRENGILIEPGDRDALANAILYLSKNNKDLEKMKENNINKVRESYSMEKMHQNLAEYYENVMSQK